MTDERAADQAQYHRIVAFHSEVRHEGVRLGIEGVGSRVVFSVAERLLFAHSGRLELTFSGHTADCGATSDVGESDLQYCRFYGGLAPSWDLRPHGSLAPKTVLRPSFPGGVVRDSLLDHNLEVRRYSVTVRDCKRVK